MSLFQVEPFLLFKDRCTISPTSFLFTGTMIEGAMARGELSPGSYTYDWVWVPRVRDNHTVPIRSIGVKNIFINKKMKVSEMCEIFSISRIKIKDILHYHVI